MGEYVVIFLIYFRFGLCFRVFIVYVFISQENMTGQSFFGSGSAITFLVYSDKSFQNTFQYRILPATPHYSVQRTWYDMNCAWKVNSVN